MNTIKTTPEQNELHLCIALANVMLFEQLKPHTICAYVTGVLSKRIASIEVDVLRVYRQAGACDLKQAKIILKENRKSEHELETLRSTLDTLDLIPSTIAPIEILTESVRITLHKENA